ncbi:MAG: hypothetical protein AAF573_21460 [Bacteroidota bacterium]
MKNNKQEIQAELEQLAPSLAKIKKQEPFEIPDQYFATMQKEVMSQLNIAEDKLAGSSQPTAQTSWVDQLWEKLSLILQPKVAVGFGVFVLLAVATFFVLDMASGDNMSLANISVEEAETYVLTHIQDFEEDELLDLVVGIDVEDISNVNFTEETIDEYMDEILDDFSEEELEDLL